MLVGTLLTRWYGLKKRSYGSVQDRIKMYGNDIKVSKIVKKCTRLLGIKSSFP